MTSLRERPGRYRVDGRRRRLGLGDLDTLSLAEARKKANAAKRKAADGVDPAVKKKERREAGTFGELADEYMKRHAKPTPEKPTNDRSDADRANKGDARRPRGRGGKRSWREDQRIINAELLAKDRADWKHVKVRDITRPMVRAVFEAIADRGAPVMANRTLALISKMLNFALSRDWIEANPASLIEKNDEESRARVLTDDELRELWKALDETERTNDAGQPIARPTPR